MRLVIDGRRLVAERTGVGRYLETLLAEWAVTGPPLRQTLVVLQDPSGRKLVPGGGAFETKVIGARWPGLIWECCALGRLLRRDDLLFAPTNLVPLNWAGRTVLVMFDAVAEILPCSFPWHLRWRFRARYRLAARRAQRVLVPSRSTGRDIARIYGVAESRIRVIRPAIRAGFQPLPADSPQVRSARQAVGVGEAPFFLFVGKRSRRRNVGAILGALHEHRRGHPDDRVVFVGPAGPAEETRLLRGTPGVHVAGHVPDDVLQALMAAAAGLLYPSEYEGFGLPILEALASGCPVVTLSNSALTEAGGNAACYLERADPPSLAETMHRLVTDRDERARRIDLGLRHATEFSPSQFAESVKHELIEAAGLRAQTK